MANPEGRVVMDEAEAQQAAEMLRKDGNRAASTTKTK